MVASDLTVNGGLLNCGPNLKPKVTAKNKLFRPQVAFKSSSKFIFIPALTVACNAVYFRDAPKPSSPLYLDVTDFENGRQIIPFEGIHDATATLKQENDILCIDMYLSMIKESRETLDLKRAKVVHLYICAGGLEEFETPGNHLVPMFVECGSIASAQQAFNKIAFLTEHAWTFLMQGYITFGKPDLALSAFQAMKESDSVPPSKFTYVATLKACTKMRSFRRGQDIHTEVVTKGMEDDYFIGNTLVDMYTKCNCHFEADETFSRLPFRDVASWNALLGGYVKIGLNQEAIECCDQMYHDGVLSDALMYACIIKACRDTGAIDKGHEIHAELTIRGFETNEFACSSLVDMYAKHELLKEARNVFDRLPYHDVVAWTALVRGYVEGSMVEDALNCLEQMQLEGLSPDAISCSFFLKACCLLGEPDKVRELHDKIIKWGLENDLCVGNSLIAAYFSCGSLETALDTFDKLSNQDIVSWNVLLAEYIEQGNAKAALNCWGRLKGVDILPDEVTFISSLKACGLTKALNTGRELHSKIVEEEYEHDPSVANVLIDMYSKCESLVDAQEVFGELQSKSVISWTALITGYVDNGLNAKALMCLKNMQSNGVLPNLLTYLCSLKACCSEGAMHKGQDLHKEIVRRGFDREIEIENVLVDMYATFAFMKEAEHVFNKQQVHDVVSWNALLSGYVQCGKYKEASKCFQQMQLEGIFPDKVTWNVVLAAYTEQEAYENALNLYGQMQEQGFLPDNVTFMSILKACSSAGAMETGKRIHAQVSRSDTMMSLVLNVLIDMYGRCGSLVAAQEVFDLVSNKDALTWNVLLASYARQGSHGKSVACYEMMSEESIKPDKFTLLSILAIFSHAGFVDEGQSYFEKLCGDDAVVATTEHLNGLLGLFGRAGRFDEALAILDVLPAALNLGSWSTLLGSFRKFIGAELGNYAFNWVLASEEDDCSAFVVMSNMYGEH